jgi:hypothetical protein
MTRRGAGVRRLVRFSRPLAALGVATALTVVLAQSTTTASFTGQTGDAGNAVTTATSFCVSPSGTTLGVTNDTYVDQASPGQLNGGSTGLTVRSGNNANAHAYLRFTLPALPQHCRITDATLRLRASSSQGPGTIDVSRASTTWTSASATWGMASQPAPAGTAVGAASGATGWHQWTVTTLVNELYAGTNDGFLVKDHVDNAGPTRTTVYESLDSGTVANRPQLVLTWG